MMIDASLWAQARELIEEALPLAERRANREARKAIKSKSDHFEFVHKERERKNREWIARAQAFLNEVKP
jgi:hypothetical protein